MNKPSMTDYNELIKKWQIPSASRYEANLIMLYEIFNKKYDNINLIKEMRVSLLDYTYSTQLKEGYDSMVKNIEKHFDKSKLNSNITDRIYLLKDLVNAVSYVSNNGEKECLSFCTKYCFQYNDDFPIYDSIVSKMLCIINGHNHFTDDFKYNDIRGLNNYHLYCNKVNDFINEFNITNKKIFDEYLWKWGKKLINDAKDKFNNNKIKKTKIEFLNDCRSIQDLITFLDDEGISAEDLYLLLIKQ